MVNVLGSLFLDPARGMWEVVDDLVDEARDTPVVVVDVHAEATSEKVALARWLDGRVTAVIGTHTHVQTADARIEPGSTAAISDAGMTGPHDSVIGVEADRDQTDAHRHARPLRGRRGWRAPRGRRDHERSVNGTGDGDRAAARPWPS